MYLHSNNNKNIYLDPAELWSHGQGRPFRLWHGIQSILSVVSNVSIYLTNNLNKTDFLSFYIEINSLLASIVNQEDETFIWIQIKGMFSVYNFSF